MRLYKYNKFINESKPHTNVKGEIDLICKQYNIEHYTINYDRTIDVYGDVIISYSDFDRLPLNFNKVSGNFLAHGCRLTSLEGSPKEVGGKFWCDSNELTSLEGAPEKVGGNFTCTTNKLTSLVGCPKEVGGDFKCQNCQLTSLEGAPEKVGGNFECNNNKLKSLKGCPKEVGGSFNCSDNQLDSFEDCPIKIGKSLDISRNRLSNVKGYSDRLVLAGKLKLTGNPVESVFNLFPEDRWKEVAEYLNEFNVIRDGDKVVQQALDLVYDELGVQPIKGYKII